jgi:hypothetical protein
MSVRKMADNMKMPYYVVGPRTYRPASEIKLGVWISVDDTQQYPYEVWLSKNDLRRIQVAKSREGQ